MVTRRPVRKSQAEELVEDKRRAMRAELAEALGRDTSRRLHLGKQALQSSVQPQPALSDELLRRNARQTERQRSERDGSFAAPAAHKDVKQAVERLQRANTAARSQAASPYARGKTAGTTAAAKPHQAQATQSQDLARPVAKRGAGR